MRPLLYRVQVWWRRIRRDVLMRRRFGYWAAFEIYDFDGTGFVRTDLDPRAKEAAGRSAAEARNREDP